MPNQQAIPDSTLPKHEWRALGCYLTFAAIMLLFGIQLQAQPYRPNSLNTNILGSNLVWDPSNLRFGINNGVPTHSLTLGNGGNGFALYNTTDQTTNYRRLFMGGAGGLFTINLNTAGTSPDGALRIGNVNTNNDTTAMDVKQSEIDWLVKGTNYMLLDANGLGLGLATQTNRLIIAGGLLFLDGEPISSTASAPITNLYTINQNFHVAKGGYLTITNGITNLSLTASTVVSADANKTLTSIANGSGYLNNNGSGSFSWSTPSGGTLSVNGTNVSTANLANSATVTYGVSGSNITATAAGGGGASVWQQNTTLTYSGTNVTMDITGGGTNYVLTLTNSTTHFVAPTGLPASTSTNLTFYLFLQQDSTGVRAVSWAGNFKWQGGVAPIITTNANAIDMITFTTSPLTTTNLFGLQAVDFR